MRYGFSLVELSIVLVILGLLTGGILSGQSLIRAAELRSITTQSEQYRTIVYTFRDRYLALPGDMANATNFWGSASSCPGTSATPSTDRTTCNGNGDGQVAATTPSIGEAFRYWQQLANGGLVEGSYTGVTDSSDPTAFATTIGKNVPISKISGVGFSARYYASIISSTNYFPGPYGNLFRIGADGDGPYTAGPAFTPEEMWGIDTKLDDGLPAFGKVIAPKNAVSCHTNDDPSLSRYALSATTKTCSYLYLLGI